MTDVNVKLSGFNELDRLFSGLRKEVGGRLLRSALNASANPVMKRARDKIRAHDLINEGDLVKGIAKKVGRIRNGRGAVSIGYKPDQFYGGFHELGTSHLPAKPHLRPALIEAESTGEIRKEWQKALKKSVARERKKMGL